eukprot:366094-Chlamydomonas_euryale.AAC.4
MKAAAGAADLTPEHSAAIRPVITDAVAPNHAGTNTHTSLSDMGMPRRCGCGHHMRRGREVKDGWFNHAGRRLIGWSDRGRIEGPWVKDLHGTPKPHPLQPSHVTPAARPHLHCHALKPRPQRVSLSSSAWYMYTLVDCMPRWMAVPMGRPGEHKIFTPGPLHTAPHPPRARGRCTCS